MNTKSEIYNKFYSTPAVWFCVDCINEFLEFYRSGDGFTLRCPHCKKMTYIKA